MGKTKGRTSVRGGFGVSSGHVNFVMSINTRVEKLSRHLNTYAGTSGILEGILSRGLSAGFIQKAGPSSRRGDTCPCGYYTCLVTVSATEHSRQRQSKGQTGANRQGDFRCFQKAEGSQHSGEG